MKWFLRIAVGLVLLLGAYAAWPVYGLYRLASLVEAKNAPALTENVDFKMLRRSLTEQIVMAYLKLTGRSAGLGQVGMSLAVGVGATVADPIVEKLLNPETLLDLLNRRGGTAFPTLNAAGLPPLTPAALGSAWQTWLNSEYRGTDYYVSLPPASPPAQQFRIRLRLEQWTWKLAGVDLPEDMRLRLAQEIMKSETAAK